ncbi:helicase C-terminal domain-containing protein [Pseudoduganella sp. UC29_106]|uniref:helicase C-terminal domain-containing protein n=1 Tax=Pseudoduganella sp. UC29_106 TaxID=3374553 RepID=UPI00375638C7
MSYTVAVRALCEFTAKQGDLDLRFTPTPTAQEGIAGHALVASRRADDYEREISLSGSFGPLSVRGRADGYCPRQNQLEEIKTYRGDLARQPANHRHLHWAQLKVYGHLLCAARGLSSVRLALVYFDIASQKETLLTEDADAAALRIFFEQQCSAFVAWAEQELAHRSARDAALRTLRFPHADFRPGQRQLAEAMYRTSARGCSLLAQAPTGIGKSIGSLFPLLKASAEHGLDKVYFLAAKTSGRAMAFGAVDTIQRSAPLLPLRALELAAKTTACEHPDKACHGESCPLAAGFYDRLPAARAAAIAPAAPGRLLDRATVRAIALEHNVCPYYLQSELVRWADVIIGDYNYYFDLSAMLYSLAQMNDWKVAVLADEAHNMVNRARQMYSAEMSHTGLKFLRKSAPEALKKPLDRVHRQWNALEKDQEEEYRSYGELPDKFMNALQTATTEIGDYMAENPSWFDAEVLDFYFNGLLFARLAESFAEHSLFDITKQGSGTRASSVLCIRNILPAPFLKPRFEAAHATALFSATLSPWNYYADTLGLPPNTAWIDVESPFAAEQLDVQVAGHISTRYQHRDRSLAPIAKLMGEQYGQQPGNYLAFFSSFDYMEKVANLFEQQFPQVPVFRQSRRMDEAERAAFLARFSDDSAGIGFAVLGGAFGEGIDLPGARLIGAFVATLGLPQVNPINEQIRERMDAIFGAGYDYTYLYPGLQKVVQAAGRVIRTTTDRGTVHLIDDRFMRPEIQALFPAWWKVGA